MSTTFCSELHKKSRTKEFILEHKRKECRFCPLGAKHSGDPSAVMGSRLYGALLCARCERHANRLVGGVVCVSCYNRRRENLLGLNAKGNPLKLIRKYHKATLLLVNEENVVSLRQIDDVMSTSEAVVSVLLKEEKAVMFGWVGNGALISAE
jgi:hypothetical protein